MTSQTMKCRRDCSYFINPYIIVEGKFDLKDFHMCYALNHLFIGPVWQLARVRIFHNFHYPSFFEENKYYEKFPNKTCLFGDFKKAFFCLKDIIR